MHPADGSWTHRPSAGRSRRMLCRTRKCRRSELEHPALLVDAMENNATSNLLDERQLSNRYHLPRTPAERLGPTHIAEKPTLAAMLCLLQTGSLQQAARVRARTATCSCVWTDARQASNSRLVPVWWYSRLHVHQHSTFHSSLPRRPTLLRRW